jgi:hypothetical protein
VKWSILILTQPKRADFLERLMYCLYPQIKSYPDVEAVITYFDSRCPIGENRAMMIEAAVGEYVNFIDDDDLVPDHYVATIYPLLDGVDYIGFQGRVYKDGVLQKPGFHSLKYGAWWEDENGYYRDLSHLNPIRRVLAMAGQMEKHHGCYEEDRKWATNLRELGLVKTEHYINQEMYYYYYRTKYE